MTNSEDRLIINSEGDVVKENKNNEKDRTLKLLKKAKKEDRYLTAVVKGVESLTENGPIIASFFIDDYRVIIPYDVFLPEAQLEKTRELDEARYILSKRLGSTIDFKVVAIDEDAKVVVGNRVEAMTNKKEDLWFRRKVDSDDYLINEGSIVEGRVVTVANQWMIVEVFGIEKRVSSKDISYIRIASLFKKYKVGDFVNVRITKLERDEETKEVFIDVSVKEAYENPVKDKIDRINIGDIYIGEVTMISKGNVFININDEFEVLCKIPKHLNAPIVGGSATVNITNINKEQYRIFGVVTSTSSVL